jgi:hypothetical protein
MTTDAAIPPRHRRGPGFFPILLGLVFLLFIGLLIFTWIATERADPVILDDKGEPR